MGGRQTRLKEHATHRNRKQNKIEIERSIAQHGQENGKSHPFSFFFSKSKVFFYIFQLFSLRKCCKFLVNREVVFLQKLCLDICS